MSIAKFECIEHTFPGQHVRQYFRATSETQEDELRLVVKQYRPRKPPRDGDVTIIAAPASGMPKEVYEPLWDALYERMQRKSVGIRAIWIADYVNSGFSAELNKGKLGTDRKSFALHH